MNKENESSVNKVIIKYSLNTLLVMVVFSLIAVFAITLIYPKQVASFSYNQGWSVMAEHYYIKAYEKNSSVDNLYNAVIISATNNSSENIVKYYEKLLKHEELNELMQNVNAGTEQLIVSNPSNIKALSLLLNEENYLNNKYVSSLVGLDELDKAFSFAKNNLVLGEVLLKNNNSFLFRSLITPKNLNNAEFRLALTNSNELENSVIENISVIFENYYNLINISNQKLENDELTLIDYAYLLKAIETFKQIAAVLSEFNDFYISLNQPHNQNIYTNTQIATMLQQAINV